MIKKIVDAINKEIEEGKEIISRAKSYINTPEGKKMTTIFLGIAIGIATWVILRRKNNESIN